MKTPQGVGCYGANERTRSEGVGCGGWGFWYWRKENVPYLLQAKKKKKKTIPERSDVSNI